MEFTRRQANSVAHALARETTFLTSPVINFRIPSYIESIIINKMQRTCFLQQQKKKRLLLFRLSALKTNVEEIQNIHFQI